MLAEERPPLAVAREKLQDEIRQHHVIRRRTDAWAGVQRLGFGREQECAVHPRVAQRPYAQAVARQQQAIQIAIVQAKCEVALDPLDARVAILTIRSRDEAMIRAVPLECPPARQRVEKLVAIVNAAIEDAGNPCISDRLPLRVQLTRGLPTEPNRSCDMRVDVP